VALGSNLAGVARVAFLADTGEFNSQIAAAEAHYRQSTATMSDDAIRMELAQNRLNRALAKFGPESAAAQRATLSFRAAQRQTEQQSRQTFSTVERERSAFRGLGRDVERAGVGAAIGSRAFHGLRSSLIFGGASFLTGFGVSSALKAVRDAAIEQQANLGQLQTALKSAGLAQSAYTGTVKEALAAQERLGFSESDSTRSFTLLVRATKDVSRATELQGIAADIARGRNVALGTAANAVARATGGQTGALRRLLPFIGKHATALQALEQAQKAYAGSAATYANSAAGAQDRLNVAVRAMEATIGKALLPTITGLNIRLAKWLDNSKNQQRVQRDVNYAVKGRHGSRPRPTRRVRISRPLPRRNQVNDRTVELGVRRVEAEGADRRPRMGRGSHPCRRGGGGGRGTGGERVQDGRGAARHRTARPWREARTCRQGCGSGGPRLPDCGDHGGCLGVLGVGAQRARVR